MGYVLDLAIFDYNLFKKTQDYLVYYIIMGGFLWSTSLQWYKLILRITDMVKEVYPLNGASLLSCCIKIVFF